MRKIAALFLGVIMTFSLAACGGSASSAAEGTKESDAAEAGTAAESTEAADMKVGFIFLHDENSTYDNNFITGAKAACEKLGVEYIGKTNIPESNECYEAAADLADAGCSIVFADSFGHESFMVQAAEEFPEVEFCHATGTTAHTENLPNFHNAFAEIYNGRYLAGVAAGMKLNEMIAKGEINEDQAKMGYVGAYTYAEVISGYTSFYLGAKSICPSVTMEVQFTGSWYDETLEKEAAEVLLSNGCVLISQHADSMGAPTACENAGVPNVSYNGSTEAACPNTYIISSRINWEPYFEYIINCAMNGEAIDNDWTGTIDSESVVLTDLNAAVAAEGTAEKIEEVKAGLMDGSIHAFDTSLFTVGGEELASYMADVDTDADYTADTEAVADGYFHESEYRSAPYFDVRIDGITTLNEKY
ncbi:MAG: BMP family ABC transporter substrate-binding protein [Lachnospiraceae bacterium]|nr:BMP family ABC transporter substrate-binding protein [Lachnospiraceae bacterium]